MGWTFDKESEGVCRFACMPIFDDNLVTVLNVPTRKVTGFNKDDEIENAIEIGTLAAAAPDMLAALKMIVDADDPYVGAYDVKQTMLLIAQEAIAKAEGRE